MDLAIREQGMHKKYFVYLDKDGNTIFKESQQKNMTFVGEYVLEEKEVLYSRYNGVGIERDMLKYNEFIKTSFNYVKQEIKNLILSEYNESIARLKRNYPIEEVTGWDYKSLQAKIWVDTEDKRSLIENKSVLMLVNESDGTIEGITELANRILLNSNLYQTIYGKNTRKYKELLAELETCLTIQELTTFKGTIKYD